MSKVKTTIVRQNVGIDLAKDKFDVCLMWYTSDLRLKIRGTRSFSNTAKGFKELWTWCEKRKHPDHPLLFTAEATGVYYEELAYFLYAHSAAIHVLLPNTVKAFAKSLNTKSKNDQIDAQVLAQMGVERRLKKWEPFSTQMRNLKKLSRQRVRLLKQKTSLLNQWNAEDVSHHSSQMIIEQIHDLVNLLHKQIKAVEDELVRVAKQDQELFQRINKVTSIEGVGIITAISIIAETNGFALIKNRSQLVCYSGYDVVENQSGSKVGKTRISKKGNQHIRRALYFPAITAVKYNDKCQQLYERVFDRTKIKMKAYVAVQRKLLLLIYALFKNNVKYDKNFEQSKKAQTSCKEQL